MKPVTGLVADSVSLQQRLMKADRGSVSAVTIPQKLLKAGTGSVSADNVMKPVRGLLGAL